MYSPASGLYFNSLYIICLVKGENIEDIGKWTRRASYQHCVK